MIHMTGIRAVVFDQDGTLIGTFIPAVHAYSAAVGRTITLEELRAVAHLGAARNLVAALLSTVATVATVDRAGLPKPAPDLHQTPDIEIFDVRAATPQDVAALLT